MYPFNATNINGAWFVVNAETGSAERCHNRATAQYLAKSKGDARHAFIALHTSATLRAMRRDGVPHFPAEGGCCDRHDAEKAARDAYLRDKPLGGPAARAQQRRIKRKKATRSKAKIVEREQA